MTNKSLPQPIGDRLLIRRAITQETKTKSGILLPDAVVDNVARWQVLKKGTGAWGFPVVKVPQDVDEGDIVILTSQTAGVALSYGGEEFRVITTQEILVILPKNQL